LSRLALFGGLLRIVLSGCNVLGIVLSGRFPGFVLLDFLDSGLEWRLEIHAEWVLDVAVVFGLSVRAEWWLGREHDLHNLERTRDVLSGRLDLGVRVLEVFGAPFLVIDVRVCPEGRWL
jgi:hypothetical protein